jgi:hypothetical protein
MPFLLLVMRMITRIRLLMLWMYMLDDDFSIACDYYMIYKKFMNFVAFLIPLWWRKLTMVKVRLLFNDCVVG